MESLALLLLNTLREEPDPLQSAVSAARWWAGAQRVSEPPSVIVQGKPRFDAPLLERLTTLRGAITAAFRPEADFEPLNGVLGAFRIRLAPLAGIPALTYAGQEPGDAVLLPIAAAVLDLLLSGQAARVRQCLHDPCARHFLDATRNASRRWCSLACMERARRPRRRLSAYRPYSAEPSSISGL